MIDTALLKAVAKGFATYLPGYAWFIMRRKRLSRHSSSSALFCYTYWLGMLRLMAENNVPVKLDRVGEVGTGGSLGMGICALLTGSKEYYALEIEDVYHPELNLKLLDEIVELLQRETPLSTGFTQINLPIRDKSFPDDLITPRYQDAAFVDSLRQCLASPAFNKEGTVGILLGWDKTAVGGFDFIFSRAVMEHVSNPESIYTGIRDKLNNDGCMLHDIELHSHGVTTDRYGHQRVHAALWKLITGRRRYFLNRYSASQHLELISKDYQIPFNSLDESNTQTQPDGMCILAQKEQSRDKGQME